MNKSTPARSGRQFAAFERVDSPVTQEVKREGIVVRTIRYTVCYGFKGLKHTDDGESF